MQRDSTAQHRPHAGLWLNPAMYVYVLQVTGCMASDTALGRLCLPTVPDSTGSGRKTAGVNRRPKPLCAELRGGAWPGQWQASSIVQRSLQSHLNIVST